MFVFLIYVGNFSPFSMQTIFIESSDFFGDNDPPKFWTLTKCHTEKWRVRRVIKTKQWQSQKHRRCIERRRQFASFIRDSIPKAFISDVIKNQYATPPSLFVLSVPPCHCLYLHPSLSLCVPYYMRVLVYQSIFRKNLIFV